MTINIPITFQPKEHSANSDFTSKVMADVGRVTACNWYIIFIPGNFPSLLIAVINVIVNAIVKILAIKSTILWLGFVALVITITLHFMELFKLSRLKTNYYFSIHYEQFEYFH